MKLVSLHIQTVGSIEETRARGSRGGNRSGVMSGNGRCGSMRGHNESVKGMMMLQVSC